MSVYLTRWLERAALLLEFAAVVFASPQLIGEATLRSMEAALENVLVFGLEFSRFLSGSGFIYTFLFGFAIALFSLMMFSIVVAIATGSLETTLDALVQVGPREARILGAVLLLLWLLSLLVIPVLLSILADDQLIRQRWLDFGVFLAVLGIGLQFVATFGKEHVGRLIGVDDAG